MRKSLLHTKRVRFCVTTSDSRANFLKYFTKVKEEQKRVIDNSYFALKREWTRYSEYQNHLVSSNRLGQEVLTRGETGRAEVVAKGIESLTRDESIYFFEALTKAMENLKFAENQDIPVEAEIKDFVGKISRNE